MEKLARILKWLEMVLAKAEHTLEAAISTVRSSTCNYVLPYSANAAASAVFSF